MLAQRTFTINKTGVSSIVQYFAISSSSTIAPTVWQGTPLAPTLANKYLWYYEKIIYADSTTIITIARIIGTYGDTGAPGATGVGISSIVNYYLATTAATGVTTATAGWTTAIQYTSASVKYLWSYTKITYTNSSTTSSTPVVIGVYGDKGDTGICSFVKYSNDGGTTFTPATASETAKIPAAPVCIISQVQSGWENGVYDLATGLKASNAGYIRTKTMYPVEVGASYIVKTHLASVQMTVICFDASQAFVGVSSPLTDGSTQVVPAGVSYIALHANTALTTFTSDNHVSAFIPAVFKPYTIDGRNLLSNSGKPVANSNYPMTDYPFAVQPIAGEYVVISIWGKLADDKTTFSTWNSGTINLFNVPATTYVNGKYTIYFYWRTQRAAAISLNTFLRLYAVPSGTTVSRIDRIQLEYGTVGTDYKPALEEQALGTTKGTFLGTLNWNNAFPSANPADYIWSQYVGADAEKYELSVVTESAMIERTKISDSPLTYSDKLTIALSYKVTHTKGSIIDYVNAAAGAYHIKVRGNNGVPGSTEFSVGTTPNYSYTLNNYSTTTNKPTQLIVELYNNTTLVETRVVPVVLKADSWIEQDAQHIALINQSAQSIASLSLANGVLTQSVANLRNGVRNLIDFGDIKTTFGSATGASAQLWTSWTKLVTLKANTTYTLTACGSPSQGTVDAGGYMPVALYGGTGNAFWKGVNFTSSTKSVKSITFSTSDSGFPTDGVLTFNAYRSGGTGGSTQTCYLDWIVITEGSVPASDYFSDVETRLANGQFTIDANTVIKRLLTVANALVGASVFNGNYQFSQYGQDGTQNYLNFDPNHPFDSPIWKSNLVIDFLHGIFMAAKGNVMFDEDGSGYLAGGNIAWEPGGGLDVKGKVSANLFYGDTIYTSSIAGTSHQINLNVNPATTFIINTDNTYTILPSISSSGIALNVELTFIFDPLSGNGAKLQAYSNEYFRLYVGGNTKIFNNISGKGWIKLKAMSLTDGNFWVLIGVGGTFTTNVSGVNHTFTADSYV